MSTSTFFLTSRTSVLFLVQMKFNQLHKPHLFKCAFIEYGVHYQFTTLLLMSKVLYLDCNFFAFLVSRLYKISLVLFSCKAMRKDPSNKRILRKVEIVMIIRMVCTKRNHWGTPGSVPFGTLHRVTDKR